MSVSVGDMSHIAALLTRRHPQLELYVYGVQRTTKRLGSKLISAATGTHSMPSQQAAHRPNFDGTRARRQRHCDRDLVRPVHARGLQGDHPPQSAPSPMLARQSDAPTHATRQTPRESPQRDRDLGKPARLDDVALPIIKQARGLREHLRSCFLMITSTSNMPGAQTKAPRKPGRSQNSAGQSLRQRPCLA